MCTILVLLTKLGPDSTVVSGRVQFQFSKLELCRLSDDDLAAVQEPQET